MAQVDVVVAETSTIQLQFSTTTVPMEDVNSEGGEDPYENAPTDEPVGDGG